MNMFLDIIMFALIVYAAVADARKCEVHDSITMTCVLVAGVSGVRYGYYDSVIVAGVLLIGVLVTKENRIFGQADILIYAALIARYSLYSLPILLLMPPLAVVSHTVVKYFLGMPKSRGVALIPYIACTMPITHYVITTLWL